ncbi:MULTISPECIES: hypothetical protein [unclassified Corynebacterium]|uniref:hypothetical protein n=1 Tax=unclassified Corynebacterium TaxID=2624378 RepID=UPI001EF69C42|nr:MULTISPECIES: hypothetical protein [unclassified Corynebacterium]MCG7290600.1 hypothetical protein [Corynebacterium sp. ACRPZ]MCG7295127.1 hypothetical protein [Corynebacterium sp. ACRPY]
MNTDEITVDAGDISARISIFGSTTSETKAIKFPMACNTIAASNPRVNHVSTEAHTAKIAMSISPIQLVRIGFRPRH